MKEHKRSCGKWQDQGMQCTNRSLKQSLRPFTMFWRK